jgi:hypothetical protein
LGAEAVEDEEVTRGVSYDDPVIFDPSKEKCPCGKSPKIAIMCCFKRGRWNPPEALPPKRRKTGYSNPNCYASATADCSKKNTSEHPFSRSILEIIATDGKSLVSGYPWLPVGTRMIGPGALTAKVLCDRHNPGFSELDDVACAFFTRVRDIGAEFNKKKPAGASMLLLNGHAVAILALHESFNLLAQVAQLALEHFGLFSDVWRERISAARKFGSAEAYRRSLDGIVAKAEE